MMKINTDEIESIEIQDKLETVYDIPNIPLYHNYILGNNILSHNCIPGIVGDMSPELVPFRIIKRDPSLLERFSYGDYTGHKFEKLASPINAACRFGYYTKAIEALYYAKTPDDILNNPVLKKYKELQTHIRNDISKKWGSGKLPKPYTIGKWCQVAVIDTEFGMHGYIASSLSGDANITTVCLNKGTGAISIRGLFTNAVVKALNKHGITAGGHPKAAGGHIPDGMTYKDIVKILENIL